MSGKARGQSSNKSTSVLVPHGAFATNVMEKKPPAVADSNSITSPASAQVKPWVARVVRRGAVCDGVVTFGKTQDLIFAALVAIGIPWIASMGVPLAMPLLPTLDPGQYWLLQTFHQLIALALTLVVMRVVSTNSWSDWGLNCRRPLQGISMAIAFALVISIPTYLLMDAAPAPTNPISRSAVIAVLLTHLLIIGSTQEVLYRGFVMGVLQSRWPVVYQIMGIEVPLRGLLAAVIFMAAHIKPFPPFVWPAQLAFSLAYGVIYAVMYQRTRSLLGPSIAHGYSNAAYVAMMLVKYA